LRWGHVTVVKEILTTQQLPDRARYKKAMKQAQNEEIKTLIGVKGNIKKKKHTSFFCCSASPKTKKKPK